MFKQTLKGIDKLVIYGNGKKLLEKTCDIRRIGRLATDGTIKNSTFDAIENINLEKEPKNARKENLTRKDNYFLGYCADYDRYTRRTALYIHESEIAVENLGEFVAMEHNGEKDYLFGYKVTFLHGADAKITHCEKMLVSGDWTIPEEERKNGAHWKNYIGDINNSYDVVDDEQIKLSRKLAKMRGEEFKEYNLVHWTMENKTIAETLYTSEGYHKIEKTDERREREKMAKLMTDTLGGGAHISHYDVDRLLEVFDITIK